MLLSPWAARWRKPHDTTVISFDSMLACDIETCNQKQWRIYDFSNEEARRRRCRGWWGVVKGNGPLQEKDHFIPPK